MTTSMPNVHPLVRIGVAAHFQLRNRTWHRTEAYPGRCLCKIDPLTADIVKASVDDSWKYAQESQWAPCITKLLRIDDAGGDATLGLRVGMRIAFDKDAAHNYEQGRGGEWYIETFEKHSVGLVARVRDKVTEIYVWAPLHWLHEWQP